MIIVASDFDGTLAHKGYTLEENKKAVATFRAKGGKMGVVTGRSLTIAHGIPQDVGGLDFMICSTGAVIMDGEGKVLFHKTQPTGEMVEAAILKARSLGCTYFGVNCLRDQYAPKMEEGMVIDFGAMTEFDHCNACFPSEAAAEEFLAYLEETNPGKWRGYRNGWTVDMPPYGCSKADAIRLYASRFEDPEVYTVGDNANDVPMLTAFPSYAVESGVEAAKQAATRICKSVATMLEELLP